jgi:hypothetical protein
MHRIVNLEDGVCVATTVGDALDLAAGAGCMRPPVAPAASAGKTTHGVAKVDHRTVSRLLQALEARQLLRCVPRLRVPTRLPCERNLLARWRLPLCPGEVEARAKAGFPPWPEPPPGPASDAGSLDASRALDALARRLDAARSFVTPSGLAGTMTGGGADGTWAGDVRALPTVARLDPGLAARPPLTPANGGGGGGGDGGETQALLGRCVRPGGSRGAGDQPRPTPKALATLHRVRAHFAYVPGVLPRCSLLLQAILAAPTTRAGAGGEAEGESVDLAALVGGLPLGLWLRVFGTDVVGWAEARAGSDDPRDPSGAAAEATLGEADGAAASGAPGSLVAALVEAVDLGGAGQRPLSCLPPRLFEAMLGAAQSSRAVKARRKKPNVGHVGDVGDR